MEKSKFYIAVIGKDYKEAHAFCYSQKDPSTIFRPVAVTAYYQGESYDGIYLVGAWYANRDLMRLYLECMMYARPGSKPIPVTVIHPNG